MLCTFITMHDSFVAPSKKHADVIIPGEKSNQVAIDLVLTTLREDS